jgi:pimeloyl-ACP methyl ester carboxylesterase
MAIVYVLLGVLALAAGIVLFITKYRVKGKTFDANGVTIHYTDEGSGPPVVLMHGFGVQGDINWRWGGFIARLRRDFRVINMDVRGHGLSGKPRRPEDYGVELAHDVIRLLDHLGIERAHVAGCSMGGFITLKVVDLYPDRLLSAVACCAGWDTLNGEYRSLLNTIVQEMEQRRSFDPITHWLDARRRAPRLQCMAVNFFMNWLNDVPAIVNVFRNFEGLVVEEASLRANPVPVLTMIGTKDGLYDIARRLDEVMANHELAVFEGCDHATVLLHRRFLPTLRGHLARHSPAREELGEAVA